MISRDFISLVNTHTRHFCTENSYGNLVMCFVSLIAYTLYIDASVQDYNNSNYEITGFRMK
jgi:hypothetical protein